jgi:hypothetical protein
LTITRTFPCQRPADGGLPDRRVEKWDIGPPETVPSLEAPPPRASRARRRRRPRGCHGCAEARRSATPELDDESGRTNARLGNNAYYVELADGTAMPTSIVVHFTDGGSATTDLPNITVG